MISTIRTHGGYFLTAELDSTVTATRTEANAWEQWDLEPLGGDAYALKSAHGRYLCAEIDGSVIANRDGVGIWETWRAIPVDGGVAFLSHHGRYLVAEEGGGGLVNANREAAGPWETFQAEFAVVVPVSPLLRLRVEDNKRWLRTDAGRFDYRDKSAFTLLGRLMAGQEDYVRSYLRARRAEGFTVLRVFICNTIGGYPSGPDQSGFWPASDRLNDMFAQEGLYLRACLIAATEPFGGVWQGHGVDIWNGSVRTKGEQFAVEYASRYRDANHVIYELFNEPCNIGLRHSQAAVIDLGKKCKAVAPSTLLMGGHYEDTSMCAHPFDIVTLHFARYMDVQGSAWIKRSSEYPPCQKKSQAVPMPALSGEPANAGQWRKDGHNQDVYRDPSISFAAAAMSRAHQYLACFHSDDALYTDEPEEITKRHQAAWHQALDAFPMSTDGLWTGHHGLAAGDYWRNVWPNSDDVRVVEQHIRDGRGPWRGYGTGAWSVCFPEPQGWNWQSALEVPAELIAVNTDGDFQVGIYRRL